MRMHLWLLPPVSFFPRLAAAMLLALVLCLPTRHRCNHSIAPLRAQSAIAHRPQIPFGTALGYAYGGFISKHLGWEWMFRLEVLPMLPLIAMIWFMPYNMTRRVIAEEVSAALAADTASASAVIADGASPKAAAAFASTSGSAAAATAAASHKGASKGKGKSAAEEELLAGLRDSEPGSVAVTPARGPGHLAVHGKQHYTHHVPPTADEVNRCVTRVYITWHGIAGSARIRRVDPSFCGESSG